MHHLRLDLQCARHSYRGGDTSNCYGKHTAVGLEARPRVWQRWGAGRRELVQIVKNSDSGVLLTTYEHLRRQHEAILAVK